MKITYKIVDQNTEDLTYLDGICDLMDRIDASNQVSYFYPPDRAFFEKTCGKKFLTILAFDGDKVVGYNVVKFLEKWPGYMGPVEGYDFKESVLFHFIIVDSDYRRLQIGKTMNQMATQELKATNRKHIFTTIHPDNTANINNAIKSGFIELEQREMFEENLLRCIMYKKI